jgi:hypothetical protein
MKLNKENRERLVKIVEKRAFVSSILLAFYAAMWAVNIQKTVPAAEFCMIFGAGYSFIYILFYGFLLIYPNSIKFSAFKIFRNYYEFSLIYSSWFLVSLTSGFMMVRIFQENIIVKIINTVIVVGIIMIGTVGMHKILGTLKESDKSIEDQL